VQDTWNTARGTCRPNLNSWHFTENVWWTPRKISNAMNFVLLACKWFKLHYKLADWRSAFRMIFSDFRRNTVVEVQLNKLCRRLPQYAMPLQVDLWPYDLESDVWVTCDVAYLWANFSLPRSLCSRLRPDVRDRQTSDSHHRLMPTTLGVGHNNLVWNDSQSHSVTEIRTLPPLNNWTKISPVLSWMGGHGDCR